MMYPPERTATDMDAATDTAMAMDMDMDMDTDTAMDMAMDMDTVPDRTTTGRERLPATSER